MSVDEGAHNTQHHSDAPYLKITYRDPFVPVHALADTCSAASFISVAQIKKWNLCYTHRRENFVLANRGSFQSIGHITLKCQIQDTQTSIFLRIVPTLASPILLGRDTLRFLPIRLFYGERLLFSGHKPPTLTPRSTPELPVGEGIRNFSTNPVHKKVVYDTIIKHKNVVSQWTTTPGLIKDAAFRIPTGDAKPIYRSAIPLSQKHQSLLQAHLDDYRARGMVRSSMSPWGATTFLVPKAGTTEMRTCHDYRPLNKITERHQYPMPCARQLLATIGTKNKFFAKIDLRWGYNQIPIEQSDIPKTAITSPCGHDEWLVMNFGFTDAPAFFQYTIERVVGDILNKGAVVYLDDILIYAETFEEFAKLLDTTLDRLNQAGAKIHIGKSDFLPDTLTYLGMIFSAKGVQHLPDRIKKLNDYPAPESVKTLRSFLGFANFFRPYIPKFATYEKQLRSLPDHHFFYTDADTTAFETLRSAVSSDSVLAPFDPTLPIQLHVDASADGLGAVLCQLHPPNNKLRVVAYASRLLHNAEHRYTNTERELLAIEWAVCDRFRLELTGLNFEVHTDHAALVHECRLKEPTSRIHRMLLKLDGFDCKIIYRPGIQNGAADFLSRLPNEPVHSTNSAVCSINHERTLAPPQQRLNIIRDYHVTGLHHFGLKKTYAAISQRFYWPGMARDIKTFLLGCHECQHYNTAKKPIIDINPINSTTTHELLNVDIVGPLPTSNSGHRYIIIAIDHFSKYGFATALSRVNSTTICQFIDNIFNQYGAWTSVVTDNAKVFTSHAFQHFLHSWNANSRFISPHHPEGNGNAERFIRTIRQLLRKNSTPDTWSSCLPKMIYTYNRAEHSATKVTPIEIFLNQPPTLSVDDNHGVTLENVRLPKDIPKYRLSYAKATAKWIPGTQVWHIPRTTTVLKSGLDHFKPTRLGPYQIVGPAQSKPGHLLVTDGTYTWPLPTWELIN